MYGKNISLSILLLFLCFAFCDHEGSALKDPDKTITDGVIHIDDLNITLTAPDTLDLLDNRFILETHLNRDFMPFSPPNGKPLTAVIKLVDVDEKQIFQAYIPEKLYVVHEESVWITDFSSEERPSSPDHIIEKIARNGPLWGPNVNVDVYVSVYDEAHQESFLIRALSQLIHRSD
ncbi:hypothetical protein ACFL67_01570 [candidate division KSB1 bacterium]